MFLFICYFLLGFILNKEFNNYMTPRRQQKLISIIEEMGGYQ